MPAIAKNVLTETWHSPQGTWRAKFREIQRMSGMPETLFPPELEAQYKASLATENPERDELKAKLADATAKITNLEHAIGVLAPLGQKKSILEQFNSIKDDEERTFFYRKHSKQLSKAIQTPDPLTTYGDR